MTNSSDGGDNPNRRLNGIRATYNQGFIEGYEKARLLTQAEEKQGYYIFIRDTLLPNWWEVTTSLMKLQGVRERIDELARLMEGPTRQDLWDVRLETMGAAMNEELEKFRVLAANTGITEAMYNHAANLALELTKGIAAALAEQSDRGAYLRGLTDSTMFIPGYSEYLAGLNFGGRPSDKVLRRIGKKLIELKSSCERSNTKWTYRKLAEWAIQRFETDKDTEAADRLKDTLTLSDESLKKNLKHWIEAVKSEDEQGGQ